MSLLTGLEIFAADRQAIGLEHKDQIPVIPGLSYRSPFAVLAGEVRSERIDQLGRNRHGALALALRPHEHPAALPLRAGSGVTGAVAGAELRTLPAVGSALWRA